ncbi:MAG: DNA methylase [Proteobacteria bacterium]|nr:DNA methylase [Pseudomonadota bacterium]NDC23683.1 DNA methylase [Pseudomonadota bacterium]NDD04255.1 DNA methylase [Pseudomonadota bacterium]NDG25572.1 DNA methylase [Pseudomonadota bacterium]
MKTNKEKRVYTTKPKLTLQTTTLWDYPSQHYGDRMQGDQTYVGATPSYIIWNLLSRYTRENDIVLDPMCGSGTTLDVSKDLNRQGIGFDIAPFRSDIQKADARKLPLKSNSVDFIFCDPPYSTHVKYSGDPQCIGELDSRTSLYFDAMDKVITEMFRVLKSRRTMALYVSDSFQKGKPFSPIGFELFQRLSRKFKPVDIVCVVRHNKNLKLTNWHKAAVDGNYFLRGFNYLFIMRKD